ncbi:uncharacterized protein [Haliotis cracherodii]|uniref:uncharacterized protein n=1 Tax=Haliotis cracherodii TaxID=6455 RepID=UPI0039ECA418
MNIADDRMGNLFSKSPGRSPSVKPFEVTSRTRADDKTPSKILVDDKHHKKLTVDNVIQLSSRPGGEAESDNISLGMSTVSKMSVKTPPPGDMPRSRASNRTPIPLRSMEVDEEVRGYYRELQRVMGDRGYADRCPSQTMLQEAKQCYRKMTIVWPEDDDGVICPSPPKTLKKDILSKERIRELDQHVFNVPREFLKQPLFDLVQYLVQKAESEVEEAHVLYRWLTSQTMEEVVTQNGQVDTPDDYTTVYLQRLKRASLSYADIFAEMMGFTSIECVKITGQMRVFPKQPCEAVTKTERHCWCAVYLGREWRLIDCFLGGKLWHDTHDLRQQEDILNIDLNCSFVADLNHFYFIPDPENLIFSHFPDRDYWQLLPRFITKAEYLTMPYLKPEFFCLNLSCPQDKITVPTKNGMCKLKVNFRKGSGMKFSYRLSKVESKKSNVSKKASLKNNVFLESSLNSSRATFLVNLTEKGKYVIEVFGKSSNLYMERQPHLCSFGISCSQGLAGFKCYPDNDKSEWGPGADVEAMGMVPVTHDSGIVETKNGEAEIVFKVPDNLTFFQTITSSNGGKDQETCVVHQMDKQKVVFTARPMVAGDSCLKILARPEQSDGHLIHVCNYLLRCSEPNESVFSLPKIPHGRIGPRMMLRKLGIRVISPKSALIYSPQSGRIDVKVQTTKSVTLRADVTHHLNGVIQDVTEFVSQTLNKNIVTFTVKLPKHGTYNINLHGKRADDRKSTVSHDVTRPVEERDGMPLLHNILVVCHWPYKDCSEFPSTLHDWGQGCKLMGPQRKHLPAGSILKFKLNVPGADDVAVLDGEDWQHLQTEDGALWEGDIMVDDDQAGSSIEVKASVGGEYRPLLQYQVLSSVEYAAQKEQRKYNSRRAKERIKKLKAERKWRDPPVESNMNVDDGDDMSLQIVDDDSEDGDRQTETESEADPAGSLTDSSTSTLRAVVKRGVGNTIEVTAEINGKPLDTQSGSSTDSATREPAVEKEAVTDDGQNMEKDDSDNSSQVRDVLGVAKTDNDVKGKGAKCRMGDEDVTQIPTGGKVKLKGNDINVKEGADDAGNDRDVKEQAAVTLNKKEVSFALEDSSSEDSDSERDEDEESDFERWQRKQLEVEQREEERTILDFSLPVRLLLKRLQGATKRKDKSELKSAMSDYQDKELDTTKREFQEARRILSVLNLRDEILDTLQRSDIKKLRVKVGDADRRGFSSEMQHEMDLARARLKASEHVQRLHVQMTTTCIDVPTLSEIIRYVKPPPLVHHVVMAMLLLMHQHEGKTRRWKKSHKRCVMIGSIKLYQKVHQVQIDDIDPTIAARARQLLEMYAPDEAGMVSPGVGALYGWVQRVVDEVLSNHDNGDEPIKPATIKMQRRIFNNVKPTKTPDFARDRFKTTSLAAVKLRYRDTTSKDRHNSKSLHDLKRAAHNE